MIKLLIECSFLIFCFLESVCGVLGSNPVHYYFCLRSVLGSPL